MWTIERKGSENRAKSWATPVDQSNLGQALRANLGPLNISRRWPIHPRKETNIMNGRECSKSMSSRRWGVRPARPQPF